MMIKFMLASVVVVSLILWVTSVDAKEGQPKTESEESLSKIGKWNEPQINRDRIKRASAAADSDVCTLKDLREFTKSNDFSAAVDYWVKNEGDKKDECIKRHGKNAYYDPDLHACGDCLDEDCQSNDVCMRECAQFLENKSLRENLNDTSKALEMLEKGRENDHKLLEDLALQHKTTESKLNHFKKTVESLRTTMLSQFQNMSDEMKSLKAEVTGLEQQNIWLWLTVVPAFLTATAAIIYTCTRSSKPSTLNQTFQPSGDVEAEKNPLMGSSSTVSSSSVPSLNTTTAAATQGATASPPAPTTPPRDNREERVDIEIIPDRHGIAGPS